LLESDATALGRLADALRRESPWPGFHPAGWPVILLVEGRAFCRGHPDPGPASPVAPGPWGEGVVLLDQAPLGVRETYRGVPTACVEDGPGMPGQLWEVAFRLHLRHRLHREPPPGMPDPEPTPAAAALAELEERVAAEALAATPERLRRALRTLCLVRRERRGPLPDEQVAWEHAAEVWDGLPAYVAGTEPVAAWARAGLTSARLLDRVCPGWQPAWESTRATLTDLLERHVRFDGGDGDEALLLGAQARHDYPQILAAARDRIAAARAAREALVSRILRGRGALLVVDTSALGEGFVEAAQAGQPVNAGMSVYPGDVAFRFRGAEVFFRDVPVVQDRRAGLLQARVPGRLRMSGDGAPLEGDGEAAFTERLELDLPGVTLRARAGFIRPLDEGLYVKLTPDPARAG
jgi:hypothetical protein